MEVFDIKELSGYLKCSVPGIRKLVRENKIPYFRVGNRLNFRKTTIDLWIQNQELSNMQPKEESQTIKSLRHIN